MKILLIEDNINIVKGLKYSFDKNNYELISKTSIKDAKDFFDTEIHIDLIILDITLPDGKKA